MSVAAPVRDNANRIVAVIKISDSEYNRINAVSGLNNAKAIDAAIQYLAGAGRLIPARESAKGKSGRLSAPAASATRPLRPADTSRCLCFLVGTCGWTKLWGLSI